jgi:hypothetical protein
MAVRRADLGNHSALPVPSGALPISDYYNRTVYDPKDNKIGEVEDLLVGQDGKIDAAIVGVGGFLGVVKRMWRFHSMPSS